MKFLPPSGGLNISFHENAEAVSGFTRLHLGFELPSQAAVDAAHDRLSEAGLVSGERRTSVCCYANQDKFRVTDPDGYEWELYYLVDDTATRDGQEEVACCPPAEASSAAVASAASCC